MSRINREEYEILQFLNNTKNWIVRDSGGSLWAYDEKPMKYYLQKKWGFTNCGDNGRGRVGATGLFQFIQWEDDEPYNIAELIEEYEDSKLEERLDKAGIPASVIERVDSFEEESEETEVKKDKQWAIKEAKETINGFFDRSSRGVAQHYEDELIASITDIIDQLDEPETLSGEWIADHYWISEGLESPSGRLETTGTTPVIRVEDLQSLHLQKNVEELNEPGKKSETVASVMADFFGAAARLKEVLAMEVKEIEE